MKKFAPTELVLNAKNQVYHLGLSPENVSEKIILVGDQERVSLVSSQFDKIEFKSNHREFFCHTGQYKNKRISVISTGIGTDNIDIVINELDALFNIDLDLKTEKTDRKQIELLRIGTCGILQSDIPVHSYILSEYALGLDNVGHFYDTVLSEEEKALLNDISKHDIFPKNIIPYIKKASEKFMEKFDGPLCHKGITVTSSGFYGPQGRELRLPTFTKGLHEKLEHYSDSNQNRFVNFEMESSALFTLGKELGHSCATICLGIANRPNLNFSSGYSNEMVQLIKYALDRI
ncbi:MAG: nucleoside phosphorylase [Bacteroidota bacterium]|nr:nucleoside phosphorylase [Bacteroidota bacterium]